MIAGGELLGVAFTVTNSARALFYLPQLAAVARSDNGARDIALCTWCMFTCNNLLGALYCGWVLGEAAMAASFVASLAGCVAMVVLTIVKRAASVADLRHSATGQAKGRAGLA